MDTADILGFDLDRTHQGKDDEGYDATNGCHSTASTWTGRRVCVAVDEGRSWVTRNSWGSGDAGTATSHAGCTNSVAPYPDSPFSVTNFCDASWTVSRVGQRCGAMPVGRVFVANFSASSCGRRRRIANRLEFSCPCDSTFFTGPQVKFWNGQGATVCESIAVICRGSGARVRLRRSPHAREERRARLCASP